MDEEIIEIMKSWILQLGISEYLRTLQSCKDRDADI